MVTELAAVDTAPPESPDTAPEAVEAQPLLGTESALTAEETDSARAPDETETEDPLAAFEPDAIKASPQVRALLEAETRSVEARKDESYRQQLAAAQKAADEKAATDAYARNLAELDEVERGSVMNRLASVLDVVADGDPAAKERLQAQVPQLREMAEVLTRSTHTRLDRQNVDTLNAYLSQQFPDYRVKPETVAEYDSALSRGDFTKRREIELGLAGQAAVEKERASLRESIARELKAEAEKTLKLERDRTAEHAAETQARPTAVSGRPAQVGTYRTLLEVAEAHMRGELTNAQVRAFRALPRDQMPEN